MISFVLSENTDDNISIEYLTCGYYFNYYIAVILK